MAKGKYSDYLVNYKRNILLSILFFILAIPFLVLTFFFLKLNKGVIDGAVIIPLVIAIIFIVLGVMFTCFAINNKSANKREIRKEEINIKRATEMFNLLPKVKENARRIIKQQAEKIAPIQQNCNDFYFALKKQFIPLLDERDWQNLDLVIYELETRRADSVKEALQLVDRELQTERIQQTIVQASEQICYEIRRGFAELKSTIIECSRVISAQLATISIQLGEMSGQLNELNQIIPNPNSPERRLCAALRTARTHSTSLYSIIRAAQKSIANAHVQVRCNFKR